MVIMCKVVCITLQEMNLSQALDDAEEIPTLPQRRPV